MTVPEPQVSVTRYEVSCLPADHADRFSFALRVENRGADVWAVMRRGSCYGTGGWDYEPSPSSRTDDWLATHRFPLDEALAIAKREAPNNHLQRLHRRRRTESLTGIRRRNPRGTT